MTEWRLAGTENPRTGEVHHWIQRDRESVDIEDVIDTLNEQQQEIERLRGALNRVRADVELWSVTGRHRNCDCRACEDLRAIAARAAGGGMSEDLNILREVGCERFRQEQKWGEQNHPQPCWLTILAEEMGEWAHEILVGDFAAARTELIQVAAVAIAAIESLDRNELSAAREAAGGGDE